jgi:hypothetical protein
MSSPKQHDGTDASEGRSVEATSSTVPRGEKPVAEKKAVVTSMVDALEDILKWERASERALRIASEQRPTELDPSN